MNYYAVQCRLCGRYSAIQVKPVQRLQDLTFKCKYCNKSTLMKHKKEFGLHSKIHGAYNSTEISKIVGELNGRRNIKQSSKN